ncbi:MAG: hypothetical protein EP330_08955 [Deltaproteobacteria bacterium]|nr:MAG: hypothetical protein EP330_08955 [Deltaproteobacteria bacterium]
MLTFLAFTALAAEPLGLTLDIQRDLLLVDGREQLTVTAILDDGTTERVEHEVEWVSSRADIVDVSRDGVAAGLQVGEAEVTASWKGLTTQPLKVEVVDLPPWRVHIEPTVLEVLPGATAELELIATLEDGRQASATRQALWQTRYSDVATVQDGIVTGKVEGETSVTATFRGTRAPSSHVNVRIPKAVGVTLDPQVPVMIVGSRVNLAARAVFATGHSLDVSKRVKWESTAPDVLHVDGAGRLTAIRGGSATIQAKWDDLEVAPLDVQVISGNVKRLRVGEGKRTVGSGDVLTVTVEGQISGRWVDLTHAVEWISSDDQVLLAAPGGLVTGVSRGRVTVTARYGALSEATEIVVTQ